jgi:copper chaperone NosL
MMARRTVLSIATLSLDAACQRARRCATCGMKIDPGSAWVAYLETSGGELAFDTPRCALTAWRSDPGRVRRARFRDYYSQEIIDADELRFVHGSDVLSPMGPDLVPVAAARAARFAEDHNGAPPKSAPDIVREGLP